MSGNCALNCAGAGLRFNSLTPGRFQWNFKQVIFKLILVIDGWSSSCEIVLRWMLLDLTDDKSTLVQVMAWCRQAASHYLSQCWPRSMSPYGDTRPQWVNAVQYTLQWHNNELDGVSNHQPHYCLLNHLFKAQIKENIKAPSHWHLWGELTGEQWIPRLKGQ